MSCVTCHMSHITYNLSLIPKATYPHPANFTNMQSKLVCEDPKNCRKNPKKNNQKGVLNFPMLAIRAVTRSLQLSQFRLFTEGTYIIRYFYMDIVNTRLNLPRGQCNENILSKFVFFLNLCFYWHTLGG